MYSRIKTPLERRLIADLAIYALTSPNARTRLSTTNGDYFTWKYMWPRHAGYFGATSTSDQVSIKPMPAIGTTQLDLNLAQWNLAQWAKDKREVRDRICDRAGTTVCKGNLECGHLGVSGLGIPKDLERHPKHK
jgi:hypothetical protein